LMLDTGMRLGEALGMRVNEFVMGRGGTPYVESFPVRTTRTGRE
jgi:integrase